MSAVPAYLRGIVDDAAIFPPGSAPLGQAVADHRSHREAEYADLVSGFVVSDVKVADLAKVVEQRDEADADLAVNLVVTGGAGAVEPAVVWVDRSPGLSLRALEFALRDEDDLARNARRLVQVVDGLGPALEDVVVYAEPPNPRGGQQASWLEALDELAARELHLKFRTGGVTIDAFPTSAELAGCIEAALDRELPFKCTAGLHNAVRHRDEETGFEHHGFLNLLVAVDTALAGAPERAVARVLARRDSALADEVCSWDDETVAAVRRVFVSFGCCGVEDPLHDLVDLGLLSLEGPR